MILAIDTSIGTSVALLAADGAILAERASTDTRGHAESIGPLLASVFRSSGGIGGVSHLPAPILLKKEGVTAVVVGVGPGPFTGLRVGIAAARAFAAGLGAPVWPVLSHDAVAAEHGGGGGGLEDGAFVVVTDAKRREHYVTRYSGVAGGVPARSDGSELVGLAESSFDVPALRPLVVRAAYLGHVALARRALGLPTGPEQPQYLREPDVTPSAGPKRVS